MLNSHWRGLRDHIPAYIRNWTLEVCLVLPVESGWDGGGVKTTGWLGSEWISLSMGFLPGSSDQFNFQGPYLTLPLGSHSGSQTGPSRRGSFCLTPSHLFIMPPFHRYWNKCGFGLHLPDNHSLREAQGRQFLIYPSQAQV